MTDTAQPTQPQVPPRPVEPTGPRRIKWIVTVVVIVPLIWGALGLEVLQNLSDEQDVPLLLLDEPFQGANRRAHPHGAQRVGKEALSRVLLVEGILEDLDKLGVRGHFRLLVRDELSLNYMGWRTIFQGGL